MHKKMPLKNSKKINAKKTKSKIACRKRIKFPTEENVSLILEKCMTDSFINMIARLEMSCEREKSKEAKNEDMKQTMQFMDKREMLTVNLLATARKIKKNMQTEILKRKFEKFKSIGRSFMRTFMHFSTFGEMHVLSNKISYPKTLRWLKKATVLDNYKVTMPDVEVHFIEQLKRGYELNMLQFIRFLKCLSEDRGLQMCTAILKLLECLENKAISKKVPTFNRGKTFRSGKLKPECKKKMTEKFAKRKLKNASLEIAEMKSSNVLLDEYVVRDKVGMPKRADLKLRILLLKSRKRSALLRPSDCFIPSIKLIPFKAENFMKSKENSELRWSEESSSRRPLKYARICKKNMVKNEKRKSDLISADLGKSTGRSPTHSQEIKLKGDALKNYFQEENYEFASELSSNIELVRPETTFNESMYLEKLSNKLLHPYRSFNTVHRTNPTRISLKVGESVKLIEHFPEVMEKENKMTNNESFNRKLQTNFSNISNTININETAETIVFNECINQETKTRGSFTTSKYNSNSLETSKRNKTVNSNERLDLVHPDINKKSLKINEVFNGSAEQKVKNKSRYNKSLHSNTLLNSSPDAYKASQSNKQLASECSLKKEIYLDIEVSEDSRRTVRASENRGPSVKNLQVKFENKFDIGSNVKLLKAAKQMKTNAIFNVISSASTKSPSTSSNCTESSLKKNGKKAKDKLEMLETKNNSICLSRRRNKHLNESNLKSKNSSIKFKRNAPESLLKCPIKKQNNITPAIKKLPTEAKPAILVSPINRNRRTFTNLTSRQVQNALAKSRKLKLNDTVAKRENLNKVSDSKSGGRKLTRKNQCQDKQKTR